MFQRSQYNSTDKFRNHTTKDNARILLMSSAVHKVTKTLLEMTQTCSPRASKTNFVIILRRFSRLKKKSCTKFTKYIFEIHQTLLL